LESLLATLQVFFRDKIFRFDQEKDDRDFPTIAMGHVKQATQADFDMIKASFDPQDPNDVPNRFKAMQFTLERLTHLIQEDRTFFQKSFAKFETFFFPRLLLVPFGASLLFLASYFNLCDASVSLISILAGNELQDLLLQFKDTVIPEIFEVYFQANALYAASKELISSPYV